MFWYSTDNKTNVKLTTWLCSRSVSDLVSENFKDYLLVKQFLLN